MDADTGECSFGDGFYQSLLNDSPVGFALVSTDGRWLRVNRAISRLLGYSPEELSKLNFQKLTHPDDLEADLQLVDDLIAGRRENYRLEKRYVRKDGSIVWGLLSVSMSRDERGRPRSEEHTSELQSLMRSSYAVFCLKKNTRSSCVAQT